MGLMGPNRTDETNGMEDLLEGEGGPLKAGSGGVSRQIWQVFGEIENGSFGAKL